MAAETSKPGNIHIPRGETGGNLAGSAPHVG